MPIMNTRASIGVVKPGEFVQKDYEFFDDFLAGGYGTTTGHKFASTANVAEWLYTALTGTPTFIISDSERGGVVAAATGAATDNHGLEAQLNGEGFALTADKDIFFEIRFKSQNAVASFDWMCGLATTETSILAGLANNLIGFSAGATATSSPLDSAAANIIARCITDSGGAGWTTTSHDSLDTGSDLTADTFVTLSFYVKMDGSTPTIYFYVNGVLKHTATANYPPIGEFMTLSFACQNNGSVQAIMEIDYIYAAQAR